MHHSAMTLHGRFAVVIALLLLVSGPLPVPAHAQNSDSYSFRLQSKGMEVLDAGLAAMGGREAIERAGAARLGGHLSVYRLGQGLRADAPASVGESTYIVLTHDYRSETTLYELFLSDTASQANWHLVLSPADTFFYDRERNSIEEIVEPDALQVILRAVYYAPAFLLEASDRAATVRWLGRSTVEGESFDVVGYVDALGQQISLFFDMGTGLLARLEIVEAHPQFGDHVVATTFTDYREAGPLLLPYTVRSLTAGIPASDIRLTEVALGTELPRELLTRPADAGSAPPITGSHPTPNLEATELADGVYVIFNATSGYNVMFVDLDTAVFVIEPVISPEVTRAVIDVVRATLPGKPISHVAMTHHHFDHSGGLPAYMAEGVTIIANPGDVQFIHEVAAVPRTLDAVRIPKGTPRVEIVEGRRTYGTGDRTVELYQVGPSPHVNELLIAYLPATGLVYVADVYSYMGQITPANDETLALADAIDGLRLELRRVIPTHGAEATSEQFWKSVRLGREAKEL